MRLRSRREEGQVYPALLLAVIGGFAIAVSFIPLQNLFDQTGRADTAGDSAALAAAKAHKEAFLDLELTNSNNTLTNLDEFLAHLLTPQDGLAFSAAQELADANGANALSATTLGYDPFRRGWVYEVITEQDDTVKGGDASANSKSRVKAIAYADGLCLEVGPGVEILGKCHDVPTWTAICTPWPNYKPPDYCTLPLTDHLTWHIKLVKE